MPAGAPFRCPICKKPVEPGLKSFPFCSERCKLLDLGKWLREDYRVSRPLAAPLAEAAAEEAGEEGAAAPPTGGGDDE